MKNLFALSIDGTPIPVPGGIANITTNKVGFLGQTLLQKVLILAFILAVILSLIFTIMGAIQWITSSGDPKQVDAARKKITFAIVGLVVTLLAFFIVNSIAYFFRVPLL